MQDRLKSGVLQIALTAVLSVIYLQTLLPEVGGHPDTAKFQFVGYVLGTPHAPGYPAYVIINHLFTTFFPFGSIAFKANLLSSIFSIAACLLLFHAVKQLAVSDFSAFVAALSFGLTRTFWSQSVVAEVYTLNALFVSAVLCFFLKWHFSQKVHYFVVACAIYAFSFGNHLTMITLLPAICFFVMATDRSVFYRPRIIGLVALFILLGALQYYYPLWRFDDPDTLYLDMQTPTLRKLLYAVTGAQFKPRMFSFSVAEVFRERIPMFLSLLWNQYLFLLAFIIAGVFALRNWKVQMFLMLAVLGNLFFALNYDIPDIFIYFIPAYLILAVYLGLGIEFALPKIAALPKISVARIPLLLALPGILLWFNWKAVDQSENVSGQKAKEILEIAGQDAVVFGRGQELPRMYFLYYVFGEGFYKKNLYVTRFTEHFMESYAFLGHPFHYRELRKNIPRGLAVYCTTEGQRRSAERMGFRVERVAPGIFRVDTKKLPAELDFSGRSGKPDEEENQ